MVFARLGFSRYEAKVYATLCAYGRLKMGKLAKYSSVPQSKIYSVIGCLEEKVYLKGGWLDAAEHGKTIQEVRFVHAEERAERQFYVLLKEKIDPVREWAIAELKENGVNIDRVRIRFDPEEGLRLCSNCGHPAKEFEECWNCGSLC